MKHLANPFARFVLSAVAILSLGAAPENKLVIHEWGTFTSLQNEKGEALGGINTDDEPVPPFVHSLDASMIANSPGKGEQAAERVVGGGKGIFFNTLHPDITMRLETPVIYFYDRRPTDDILTPLTVDLSVTFHGGYLSQFYPDAVSSSVKLMADNFTYVAVNQETTHRLDWPGLMIGGKGDGPKTEDKVWLSPRKVASANVTSRGGEGESEKFVFYRGVGHLDGPIKVVETSDRSAMIVGNVVGQQLNIRTTVDKLWLVDIAADSRVAMRTLDPVPLVEGRNGLPKAVKLSFEPADYSVENLKKLRNSMRDGLITGGLFADEADAMLDTWEASYFKSPGLRLFYLVPREWTDQKLPMKVSQPVDITRVMVGRIELISQEQKELLATMQNVDQIKQLGRFAAALMNDEQRRNPSPRLATLIHAAQYEPARIAR